MKKRGCSVLDHFDSEFNVKKPFPLSIHRFWKHIFRFNLRSQPAYEESTRAMALHPPLLATEYYSKKQELSAVILCSKRSQPTLARSNIWHHRDHVMDRAGCTLSNTTVPPKWFIRASSATQRLTSAAVVRCRPVRRPAGPVHPYVSSRPIGRVVSHWQRHHHPVLRWPS
jgi:hypothetical protein